MRMSVLLRKLRMENTEFVTSKELRDYCKAMKLNYDTVVRYFSSRKYLVRTFKGIFYVRSLDELKLGRSKYNHLEIVAKALEIKRVKNWYFGLHTALKLNNMTHEHFTIEEVISDSLFRANPINITGYKFKFIKLSSKLLGFGVRKEENGTQYSDPEKTLLDFAYVWRYNGVPETRIIGDLSDWARRISRDRLTKYAKNYPATVARIMKNVL